jgi:hypothetical protein
LSQQCYLHQVFPLKSQQRCHRLQNFLVLICQFTLLPIYILRWCTQSQIKAHLKEHVPRVKEKIILIIQSKKKKKTEIKIF